jgi:hypothetical protein
MAFSADPVARWFYPDPHEYLIIYRASSGHLPAKPLNTRAPTRLMDIRAPHSGSRRTSTPTRTRWSRCFNARFQKRTDKRSLPLSSRWIAPTPLNRIGTYQWLEWTRPNKATATARRCSNMRLNGAMARANSPISNRQAQRVSHSITGTGLNCSAQFRSGRHLPCFRCCGNRGDSYSLKAMRWTYLGAR